MPSIREFKARLSFYITESRAGKPVEITWHRQPVARLVGLAGRDDTGLARMVARGELEWSGGKPAGSAVQLPKSDTSLAAMVLEDRR